MKRRILSLLVALVLCLGMVPGTAMAVGDAVEVSTKEQLAAITQTAGSYVLTADIELGSDWTPLEDNYAAVQLDGNGHTITLSGTPLFDTINNESSVTNLIVMGDVTSDNHIASLTNSLSGTIRNCVSYTDVTYTGASGGWSPKFAAGLAAQVPSNSGGVANSVYAGNLNAGNADCSGAIANTPFGVTAAITDCIGIGAKVGMAEGISGNSDIGIGTNTLVADRTTFDASLSAYAAALNAGRQDGDLEWEVKEGKLALKAVAVVPATDAEKQTLTVAIDAAEAVDTSKLYTAESWEIFSTALTTAKGLTGQESPSRTSVVNATNGLTAATAALIERPLAAAAQTDNVVEVTQANYNGFSNCLASPSVGAYYLLTEDIIISGTWFGNFETLNATLDGNGHTITLNGSPLYGAIGPDGVVQNLGILGSAQNSTSDTGALAKGCQGLIINCWSQAAVTSAGNGGNIKNTGGLVANLQSGGAIVNSYVSGQITAKGSIGDGEVGALAGTAAANTMVKNGYWLEGIAAAAVGGADGQVVASAAKTRPEFYGDDFLVLLNAGRDANCKEWTLSDEGWPHLGEAGSFQPPTAISLTFTAHDGVAYNFTDAEGLTLPLSAVMVELGQSAGQLSYPTYNGKVAWVPDYDGSNKDVMVSEDGSVTVTGAGSTKVAAYDKSSLSGTQYETKLAEFNITVTEITADGLRLGVSGENLTVDTPYAAYTVAGSTTLALRPEILVNHEWKAAPVSYFTLTNTGKIYRINGVFSATEPGEMTVTASGLGQTATVKITSTYVPVTKITPAPSGAYTLHGRNANSTGLGDFLDLTLASGAGTVIVEPENASYRDAWTLTSSNDDVAEYRASMLRAVLPKKAGTVTLTATSTDPRLTSPVTGTSEITLSYLNPLTEVQWTGDAAKALTVEANQTVTLPLTFAGTKSDYHVTEPGMVWTYAGDGEVEISRPMLGVLVGENSIGEYCVANDQFQLTGVSAGTVTVTGTPVDQTGDAAPITFTVTVTGGTAETPADNTALITDGIQKAKEKLQALNGSRTYQYGDEWDVFILTRTGVTVDVDSYLTSVKNVYMNPTATELKPTTIARVILTLGVLGKDASDFEGLDLVSALCNGDQITDGGNESMWALIALDSLDYAIPTGARWTREKLVTELLTKYQNPTTGGFGLNDNVTSSVDMTAMAIQALAPYVDTRRDAGDAVDKALDYLRGELDRSCRYDSSESVAQVLVALTTLDKDPTDTNNGFVKSVARNLITGLVSYRESDGGFRHLFSDAGTTKMSTIQGLSALEACRRLTAKANALYDLSDINIGTILAARIKEAESLTSADYTAGSWSALQTALANAKQAQNGTAAEKSTAAGQLAQAIAALQLATGGGSQPQPGGRTITVSFRLVGDAKHSAGAHTKYVNWIKTFHVTVPENSTVYDALKAALDKKGMAFVEREYSYISKIQAPSALGSYWLSELDNGPNSGWKYLVNGSYPNVGLRYYWLEDGDEIVWRYVDDYTDTADNTTKWQEAPDVNPSGSSSTTPSTPVTTPTEPAQPPVVAPSASANKDGEATATVTSSAVNQAVSEAKKNNADAIVIAPEVKGDASKVTVEVPKRALADTTVDVTVKSDLGTVTLPSAAVQELTQETGSTLGVSVEAVKGEDGKATGETKVEVKVADKPVEKLSGGLGVTLPAESGNVLAVVDADGNETIVKKSVVDDKTVSAILDGSCTVKVVDNTKTFADTANHWAKASIDFASSHELFNGVEDNKFAPNAPMNRAMLATVLFRLEDAAAEGTNPFDDVAQGTWYTDAVTWASAQDIVRGTGNGFAPQRPITRQEIVVMLHRYAKTLGMDVTASGDLGQFTDAAKTSGWATDAMKWAVGSGLISGKGNGVVDPTGNASRAEVATMLQRLVKLMVK